MTIIRHHFFGQISSYFSAVGVLEVIAVPLFLMSWWAFQATSAQWGYWKVTTSALYDLSGTKVSSCFSAVGVLEVTLLRAPSFRRLTPFQAASAQWGYWKMDDECFFLERALEVSSCFSAVGVLEASSESWRDDSEWVSSCFSAVGVLEVVAASLLFVLPTGFKLLQRSGGTESTNRIHPTWDYTASQIASTRQGDSK